jgi:SAM-dependent methyltransferase
MLNKIKKIRGLIKIILIKIGCYDFVLYFLHYKTNRSYIKSLVSNVKTIKNENKQNFDDVLNILYRMNPVQTDHDLIVESSFPIAKESLDHINPSGTINDNTRKPRFVKACEQYMQQKLSYLDLGCSGGGLVRNFLDYGHFSIGIEGSNLSFLEGRAEWSRIPRHLFTADITKPFTIKSKNTEKSYLFDIIGAWEVMEHLPEELLPSFCKNIVAHLDTDGIFIASVAMFPLPNHICLHEEAWWIKTFAENGLYKMDHSNIFNSADFPRGGEDDWARGQGFHIMCKKTPSN